MENVQFLIRRFKISVILPSDLGQSSFSLLPRCSGMLTGSQETAIIPLRILWPRFFIYVTAQDGSTRAPNPE